MIVERTDALLEESGLGRKTRMGMRAEDAAYIFSILRGSMYSNKPLAIIREYTTNAWDAHVEAGIDRPIQITCASYFTPTIRIRDFGNGLSQDEVFEYFGNYGASKKRDTNDQVGMMGIGCKSAFCDNDEWNIVSIHNGVKTTYLAFIDNSNIGEISIVGEEKTDEESGIEIVINIRREDIYRYNDAIAVFCREFNPKPIIIGDADIAFKVNDFNPEKILSGSNWEIRKNRGNDLIMMGNIVYPINRYSVDFPHELYNKLHVIPGQVIIHANIGDVIPASNREALNYNKTTREFIINTYLKIFDEFKQVVDDTISKSANVWEAKCILSRFHTGMLPNDYSIDVHGKTIDRQTFLLRNVKGLSIRRKYNKKWEILDFVNANPNFIFFVSKGNVPRNSIFARVATHTIPDENCIVLGFDNEQSYNNWIAEREFDGANIIDIASIPYVHNRKKRIGVNLENAVVYQFMGGNYNGTNKSAWISVSEQILNDPNGGVFVPIKHRSPILSEKIKTDNPIEFVNEVQNFFRNVGIPVANIYGMKQSDIDELHSGWISFDQYIQGSLDTLDMKTYNTIIYQLIKRNTSGIYFELAYRMPDLFPDLNDQLYANSGYLHDVQFIHKIRNYGFDFDISPYEKANEIVNELRNKYPMIKYLQNQYIAEYDTLREYIIKMNE